MRTILTTALALTATVLSMPSDATASHNSPLSNSACAYRDAVDHFSREAIAYPQLTRFEKRVALQLAQAAGRLDTLAQHPYQQHSISRAWMDVLQTHQRVESVLFSHPGCPVYVALSPCWQEVLSAYNDLTLVLTQLGCHSHSHGHTTHYPHYPRPGYPHSNGGNVHILPVPQVTQPSYRYRDAIVPSYRYGNYAHAVVPPLSNVSHSPSQAQTFESERHIEREESRRQLDRGSIGAVLSRRMK